CLLDIREPAIDKLTADIPQNNRHTTRTKPLRNPRTHYTGSNHRRVNHLFRWRLLCPACVFFSKKEIANQISSRLGIAELDNRVELRRERFLFRQILVDDFKCPPRSIVRATAL